MGLERTEIKAKFLQSVFDSGFLEPEVIDAVRCRDLNIGIGGSAGGHGLLSGVGRALEHCAGFIVGVLNQPGSGFDGFGVPAAAFSKKASRPPKSGGLGHRAFVIGAHAVEPLSIGDECQAATTFRSCRDPRE